MVLIFTPRHDWPIKRRTNNRVPRPVGYAPHPTDETIWLPDMEQIIHIEEALDMMDNENSLREIAGWLSDKINRKISHQTVANIWKRHRGSDPNNPRANKMKERYDRIKPKTKKEKLKQQVKLKIGAAKRMVIAGEKRLERFKDLKAIIEPDEEVIIPKIPQSPSLAGKKVVFEPNEGPQTLFLAASEQEVLYGGAAGGGKTYALLADPMRYFNNPNFRGVLFRRTNDELRELTQKSHILYRGAFPQAKWQEQKSLWTFPSGATMWLTYLDDARDLDRYQGQSFCWIGFDELTHWPTPEEWDYLRSRLRSTDPTLPLSQRATCNPGGVGHAWVKKMFIDPSPYNTTYVATDIDKEVELRWPDDYPDLERRGKPLFYRRFIPAKLSDNPALAADGRYEASLLSMPEATRRQLLYGDWAISEGAAFPEFRVSTHVIPAFNIPSDWRRFRSCDYGYRAHTAVHWFAIDPTFETLYVYRELYTKEKTGRDLAKMILSLEYETREKIDYGILDSSVWHQRGHTGPTVAEEMITAGVKWRPSDRGQGSRIAGKNRFHELLKLQDTGMIDENKQPIQRAGIVFFENCRHIIADLPMIPMDPHGSEDIDDKYPNDHTYDSIRYGIMSRPRSHSPFDFGNSPGIFNDNYIPRDKEFGY